MKDADQLSSIIEKITAWAGSQSRLRRLWIYGSRARGTQHAESDLDLAFEIDPLFDEPSKTHFREQTLPAWKTHIQSLSIYPVHIEPWAGGGTNVAGYVLDSGRVIYERNQHA